MNDYSELKKAAEACGPLPWRLIERGITSLGVRDDHGFIAFMDISHPAKYGACPDREAKARFIGYATPAAVLALIDDLLCPACKGSGEGWVMSDASPDGHNILADCQECNGRGSLLGAYESMKAQLSSLNDRHVAAGGDLLFMRIERDQLKAENEVLRKDADRDLRVKQAMRLDICEVAAVIGLTDNELDNGAGRMVEAVKGLVQDSERLDWLNIRSAPVVEGQCMGQPEGELAGYQWSVFGACSTVREAIDYAMEGELDHG